MARFDGGWVKLHRKAALGDINANYTRGGLFAALIAMANLQNSTVSWRGKPKTLERGEVVTSMRELADLGEVDRSTVMRHLSYLESRGTIKIEKSNRGVLIKILNYAKYQDVNASGPHQAQQQPHIGHNIGRTHIEELKKEEGEEDPKPNAFKISPGMKQHITMSFPAEIKRIESTLDTMFDGVAPFGLLQQVPAMIAACNGSPAVVEKILEDMYQSPKIRTGEGLTGPKSAYVHSSILLRFNLKESA